MIWTSSLSITFDWNAMMFIFLQSCLPNSQRRLSPWRWLPERRRPPSRSSWARATPSPSGSRTAKKSSSRNASTWRLTERNRGWRSSTSSWPTPASSRAPSATRSVRPNLSWKSRRSTSWQNFRPRLSAPSAKMSGSPFSWRAPVPVRSGSSKLLLIVGISRQVLSHFLIGC